jgi:hypothetical protein
VTSSRPRVAEDWLAVREPADARARSSELVDDVARGLEGEDGPHIVWDLAAGSGSMLRWLAPRLPGAQHWVLVDHDLDLLAAAREMVPPRAADGAPVTVETRCRDVAGLEPGELAGASLVTVSALLDIVSRGEMERIVASCLGPGCPVLLTLHVTGEVGLEPAEPLDVEVRDAFNAHQRRTVDGVSLLGPYAVSTVRDLVTRHGARLERRSSPWRLGPGDEPLIRAWLRGWVDAACERRPDLARQGTAYLKDRLGEVDRGELRVVVRHEDLLVLPPRAFG